MHMTQIVVQPGDTWDSLATRTTGLMHRSEILAANPVKSGQAPVAGDIIEIPGYQSDSLLADQQRVDEATLANANAVPADRSAAQGRRAGAEAAASQKAADEATLANASAPTAERAAAAARRRAAGFSVPATAGYPAAATSGTAPAGTFDAAGDAARRAAGIPASATASPAAASAYQGSDQQRVDDATLANPSATDAERAAAQSRRNAG
jgi:hypothetical protein